MDINYISGRKLNKELMIPIAEPVIPPTTLTIQEWLSVAASMLIPNPNENTIIIVLGRCNKIANAAPTQAPDDTPKISGETKARVLKYRVQNTSVYSYGF